MRAAIIMLGKGAGGLEQCALDYADALQERGLQTALVMTEGAALWQAAAALPVTRTAIKRPLWWDPWAAGRLTEALADFRPQAVICHGGRALSLALRAFKGKIPVVAAVHNDRIKGYDEADAWFPVSRALHEMLINEGFGQDNVVHVPNMIRIPMQLPSVSRAGDPALIGYMGRLAPEKGAAVLIEAAALLQDMSPSRDFRVLIGGEGPERHALEKKVRALRLDDVVEFCGWISDKPAFFRKLDLFCLPSLRESFGLSLLEAMGAGVPVVATDCDGPRELVEHARSGLIVPAGSPVALAHAMKSVISKKPDEIARMIGAAFETAKTYSMSASGEIITRSLTRLVRERRDFAA